MESFWWFAREIYNIDGNPKGGWLSERIHKPMCDWFERHVKEWLVSRAAGAVAQKNLMIIIPREFGKTTLITRAGLLWLHLQDPELSVYIGSENLEKAADFLGPIPNILNGADAYQKFTQTYGNWYSKDRVWRSDKIVHALKRAISVPEPSFGAWGVATGLTGVHPDVLCFDDPNSYEKQEKDSDWFNAVNRHVASLIPVLKGNGLRIFIGTRYHDGDHLGAQLRKHGAATVSGMKCPDVDVREDGIWHLFWLDARDAAGAPTYPEVWTDAKLKEYEREHELQYWAQMRNAPHNSQHVPLQRWQVEQCWVDKKNVPTNLRITVHVDTAFKTRERLGRGDESVIVVMGHARDGSGDVYYLEGYGSDSWRAEDFNSRLVQILQRYWRMGRFPSHLTDELEGMGKTGTWELTLQSWCSAGGIPMPPFLPIQRSMRNKKYKRLVEAASYWVDGHVKLVRESPGVEQLVSQMLKIGTSAHDDWADAAADAFQKGVYMPMRPMLHSGETSDIVRPYDDELQPGNRTYRGLIDQYKRSIREGANGYEFISD